MKLGLDHGAMVIAIGALVVLSIWPLPSSHGGEGEHEADAGGGHGDGGQAAHWSYGGADGPDHWADLSSDYHVCRDGRAQSPIDITSGYNAGGARLDTQYVPSKLAVLNNGHTLQANYSPGNTLNAADKAFELLQFHFHAPSEHWVDGQQYAAEVHFVHKAADGELAVIGVLINEGAENAALATFWNSAPGHAGEEAMPAGEMISAASILPATTSYRHYKGSLTTPPCSEGVNWFVLDDTITMSAAQIGVLSSAVGANARPAQPLNARLILNVE